MPNRTYSPGTRGGNVYQSTLPPKPATPAIPAPPTFDASFFDDAGGADGSGATPAAATPFGGMFDGPKAPAKPRGRRGGIDLGHSKMIGKSDREFGKSDPSMGVDVIPNYAAATGELPAEKPRRGLDALLSPDQVAGDQQRKFDASRRGEQAAELDALGGSKWGSRATARASLEPTDKTFVDMVSDPRFAATEVNGIGNKVGDVFRDLPIVGDVTKIGAGAHQMYQGSKAQGIADDESSDKITKTVASSLASGRTEAGVTDVAKGGFGLLKAGLTGGLDSMVTKPAEFGLSLAQSAGASVAKMGVGAASGNELLGEGAGLVTNGKLGDTMGLGGGADPIDIMKTTGEQGAAVLKGGGDGATSEAGTDGKTGSALAMQLRANDEYTSMGKFGTAQQFTEYLRKSKAVDPAASTKNPVDNLVTATEGEGDERVGQLASAGMAGMANHASVTSELEARTKAAAPFQPKDGQEHTIRPSTVAKMRAGDEARGDYADMAGDKQKDLISIGRQRWFQGSSGE